MQLQTTSPESNFPDEYSGVIFIQMGQHLKELLQKYNTKGSRFYESRCSFVDMNVLDFSSSVCGIHLPHRALTV